MHLVEMTFEIEAAAGRLPANTEPATEDVLIEQSFPRDEQLSNLFHPMLLQTRKKSRNREHPNLRSNRTMNVAE
jgi:hypothetical protein